MNTYSKIVLAFLGIMLPFSLALAKEGGSGSGQDDEGAGVRVQSHLELEVGDDDASSSADVDIRGEATPGEHGEKEGLIKHFSTTTPPGFWEDHRGSTTKEHGSSTREGEDNDKGKGEKHGNFITAFFTWLFNLPADTTVGDIRAQIEASSSATTTASTTPSESHGLGFWAKVFGFLHLGGDN